MSKIKKPFELEVQKSIKALIYGQPGIGKTTTALSSPNSLLLDFDGGVHRINPIHQTDTVQVSSWQDVIDAIHEDIKPYQTIVIDTAGKMLDYMSAYIIKNDPKMGKRDGSLSLQGYGARKMMFINFLKQVSVMGKNIIFVAHDREEKNGDERIIRPEIGGSSAGDLIKELDLVGYMEMIGNKRTISFNPCEKYYGKNTCNLEPVITVPNVNNEKNYFLSDIIKKYQDSLEDRKSLAANYNTIIDLIDENLISVKDVETAQEFIAWIETVNHVWDSKLNASIKLRDKAKELNIDLKTKKNGKV